MKRFALSLCILLFCAGTAMADGLDTFLGNLNAQAAADRHGVVTSVGSHFGVPYSDVELIMGTAGSLADAFMVLQIGRWTGLSRDRIMNEYRAKKGQGWGVIAKDLGIKPGSAEFHALKNGDFGYSTGRSEKGGASYSDGKGKNNGGGQDNRPMPTDQTGGQGKGKGKKK
ncbi:hypothetical protein NLA06_11765 [Desulfomicrobium sp. ZS1]|jgi:hypothetical protein|uniref:hypothetical protein n=1 Tax=Desulfomicrobium sp. ZS1 TaxID=2952228 RepID=UPI0020B255B7|nr:hypothetical protein [Desulfomicrobium sp. ZS1]UTF49240.1 hypothetical protein NLA06_11765 [Desulfomicrobium sp. ZS1]